jgi:hypothetical protein
MSAPDELAQAEAALDDEAIEDEGEEMEEEEQNNDEEETEEEEQNNDKEDDKPPEWGKSKARDYLYGLIVRGELPDRDSIKPKQVFETYCKHRPEFKHFQDYKGIKFATKLLYLRKRAAERDNRSQEDAAALAHDRLIFPPQTEDTKGRPIWAGSNAQTLLRDDIKIGKHKTMKPKDLYESRDEYHEDFNQDFFREKIYQEVKALKREVWVKAKSEKAKQKKK